MKRVIAGAFLICAACSDDQPVTPGSPTPPTPAPVNDSSIAVTGVVAAANGGQPLGGVTVDAGSQRATTDGTGAFTLRFPAASSASVALTLSGNSIVTRRTALRQSAHAVSISAIAQAGFDLTLYRQLVRNAVEEPNGGLRATRLWLAPPQIYYRTIDEANRPIDSGTLDATESTIREAMRDWSGGGYPAATVVRGTESREGVPGWVTVLWAAEASADGLTCGSAQVATSGGRITFYPRTMGCRCAGSPGVTPGVVRHEIGHMIGYWHTDNANDVMYPTITSCTKSISDRERYHAAIALTRPNGNTDPDNDPASVSYLVPQGAAGPIVR